MRRFSRSRRPRPRVRWVGGMVRPTITTASSVASNAAQGHVEEIVSSTQVFEELDGAGTLVRLVGELHVQNQFPTVAQMIVYVGFRVIELPAIGSAPILSLQDEGEQASPWLLMRTWVLGSPETVGEAIFHNQISTNEFHVPYGPHFDIKVRRKLRQNQAVVLYMNGTDATGAAVNVNYWGNIRALCALK